VIAEITSYAGYTTFSERLRLHPLGKFSSGYAFYSFDQPIVITQVKVFNPALLTSATFGMDFAGDAVQ